MTNYTPSTTVIRTAYVAATWKVSAPNGYVEFDRWLAQVKADAWDEGWRSDAAGFSLRDNPYRQEDTDGD